MRIRKHTKISPLVYTTSSLEPGVVIQTHACQLNQSMWDVATFSPETSPEPASASPSHQARDGGVSAVKVTSGESIQRYINKGDDPAKAEEPVIICGKSDGKSWQCRREASKGNSLCEHHLSQAKSYPKSGQTSGRRTEKPQSRRVKKSQKSSSSNPYEFYYYSGFGPRWGKKRGGESSRNDNGQHEHDSICGSMAEFDLMEEDEQYIYDDDDEEDDESENGKKKARKPVKARSLKSLM